MEAAGSESGHIWACKYRETRPAAALYPERGEIYNNPRGQTRHPLGVSAGYQGVVVDLGTGEADCPEAGGEVRGRGVQLSYLGRRVDGMPRLAILCCKGLLRILATKW